MIKLSGVKQIELENGLKILAEKVANTKKTALMFGIKVGSVDENDKLNGGSHFLEHMFFKSNKFRSAEQIVEDLEYMGAYSNAFTAWTYTTTQNKILAKYSSNVVDILKQAIFNFEYVKDEFNKEKQVILTELNNVINSPEKYTIDHLFIPTLYKGTSLERGIGGTNKSLKEMKLDELIEFKRKFYVPNNMVVSLTGRIDQKLIDKIKKEFGEQKTGKVPKREKINLKNKKREAFEERKNINQMYMNLGWKVPGFQHEDLLKLDLLAAYLGMGLSSKLFKEFRIKKGIGYGVGCFFLPLGNIGIFAFDIVGFSPKKFEEAKEILFKVIDELKNEDIAKKDLEGNKNLLISNHEDSLEDIQNRAIFLLESEIHGKKYDYRKKEQFVRKITSEDLRKMAEKYFTDKYTLTALGPSEAFK